MNEIVTLSAAITARKKAGAVIGSIREEVMSRPGVSQTHITRALKVHECLIPELHEFFRRQILSIAVTYTIANLEPDMQHVIYGSWVNDKCQESAGVAPEALREDLFPAKPTWPLAQSLIHQYEKRDSDNESTCHSSKSNSEKTSLNMKFSNIDKGISTVSQKMGEVAAALQLGVRMTNRTRKKILRRLNRQMDLLMDLQTERILLGLSSAETQENG